jgi:hypothetical protein
MSKLTTYVKDLVERVGATFVEAALGALGAAILVSGLSFETGEVALMAGIAAAVALIKGWVAKYRSNHESASLANGV